MVYTCVATCVDVFWRVEDLLALLPTLFVGLLGQHGNDSWKKCLAYL